MLEKTLLIQDLSKNCVQLSTGINVVILHKLIQVMLCQMCVIIKAQSGPTKYVSERLFGLAVCVQKMDSDISKHALDKNTVSQSQCYI